jgi:hypothetical protein
MSIYTIIEKLLILVRGSEAPEIYSLFGDIITCTYFRDTLTAADIRHTFLHYENSTHPTPSDIFFAWHIHATPFASRFFPRRTCKTHPLIGKPTSSWQ